MTTPALSGDGVLVPLRSGGSAHVRFTFRNLARLEEHFGGIVEWLDAVDTQPHFTVLRVLTLFQAVQVGGRPATLDEVAAECEGLDINVVRTDLVAAYKAALPGKSEEQADPPAVA